MHVCRTSYVVELYRRNDRTVLTADNELHFWLMFVRIRDDVARRFVS
jgi:hypothetical protein